jgi:hypothetical protein
MRKDLVALMGAVCLLTLGVLGFAMKSRASVVTNVDIPLSGVVFNPCNGENVSFTGLDHFTARVTLSGAGFHVANHENIHVTASGDQGNAYVGNQEDNSEVNGRVGIEQTMQLVFSEISKGSAPNFEVHAIFHITANANGTVTAFVNNFTTACRG